MKHRLFYLASILLVFVYTGASLINPSVAQAAPSSGSNPFNNCTSSLGAAIPCSSNDKNKTVAQECPIATYSGAPVTPTGAPNYGGTAFSQTPFFKCEKSWAQNHSSSVPKASPSESQTVPDSNYCANYYTGDYLTSCNKGFSKGASACASNDPICKGAAKAAATAKATQNNPQNGNGNNSPSPNTTPSCDAGSFSLNWILCPIYNGVATITQYMFANFIQPLLVTQPICLPATGSNCNDTVYTIWSSFRVYGDIFLIIALLVVVFGESIGGGLIDAYTAKKILPRLLAAAILINLSIYIMAFSLDMSNVVGGGIGQLLTAPLKNNGAFTIQPSGGVQAAIGTFGATGLIAGGLALGLAGIVLLLVGLAITGALAILGVFVTLILRQSIIIALVLISPVAFALWCLPNTSNWFKRWWDTFFQMLLVYPMVVVLFAVADIMSYVTENNGKGGGLSAVISFMLLIMPLYLVPFTLRSSNRLLGGIQGAMSRVGKQVNAVTGRRAIAGATAEVGKNWEATKAGNRFRGGTFSHGKPSNRRGRLNQMLQGATLASPSNIGLNPRRMKDRLEAARSAQTTALSAEADKSVAVRAVAGNDDLLTAAVHGTGTEADSRAYLQDIGQRGAELEQNVASIRQARRDMGDTNFQDFAAANLAGTGTGYKDGPADMLETINRVAGGDRARATRILASARSQAERAKRADLYGAGFATSADAMSQLYTGNVTAKDVDEVMTDEALNVQSAGVVGTARNNSLKNMVGSLERRMARAQAQVVAAKDAGTREKAVHEQKRIIANTASLLEVAGSSSPENAQIIGAIMGQNVDIGGTNKSLGAHINDLRNDAEFQQYRREYGSAGAAAAAEAGTPTEPVVPPEEQH